MGTTVPPIRRNQPNHSGHTKRIQMTTPQLTLKEKVITLKGLLAEVLLALDDDSDDDDTLLDKVADKIDVELNYPTPSDLRYMIQLRKRIINKQD